MVDVPAFVSASVPGVPLPQWMEWCGRREKEKILTGRIMSGGDGQFEDAESQPSRLGV